MSDVTTTSGAIHFSGLGNGTDFDSLITKLVAVEQQRVTSLETWRESWTDKVAAFQDLNTKMLSLKTTLEGMSTVNKFMVKTATSSDTTKMSVAAGAEASEGVHTVVINQLAQNKIMVTQTGYATTTEDINVTGGTAVFAYDYKGATYTHSIPDPCSLTDLAAIINQQGSNPGVRAAIINDGTNNYFQLRGLDTGSNATLTISGTTTLTNFQAAGFNTVQANQNARLKVDGWPAASYIERHSNTISDVIPGLTMTLKATGTVTVDTVTDTEAIKENVREFVDQVNVVRQAIIDMTKVDETTKTGSILTGNYGVQIISSKLKDDVSSKAIGFDWDIDDYVSLTQVGITTDANEGSPTLGLLLLDEDELDAALDADADGVAMLFSAYYQGNTNTSRLSYTSHIQGITQAGEYEVAYTVAGGAVTGATINGNPATFNGSTITGGSGYPEAGLLIEVNDLTAGSYTGNVYLKLGKTNQLIDDLSTLTNATTGPLAILEDNYDDITASIDKKIDFEERRITLMESRLRERYARLDAMLGYYDQLSTSLTSQIAKLDSD